MEPFCRSERTEEKNHNVVKRCMPSWTQLHPRGWLLTGWGSRASSKRKVIVMKPRCQFCPPEKPTTLTSHKSSSTYCTESGFGGLSHPWRSRPWCKWLWLERKSSIYNWATLGGGGGLLRTGNNQKSSLISSPQFCDKGNPWEAIVGHRKAAHWHGKYKLAGGLAGQKSVQRQLAVLLVMWKPTSWIEREYGT